VFTRPVGTFVRHVAYARFVMGASARPPLLTLAALIAISASSAGCGSASRPVVGVNFSDIPSVTFNPCLIPAGQPTWANILLAGGKGRFRAIWSIGGQVDSTDPQRTIPVAGKGTRLEILVTLNSVGQTFRVQVFNARTSVGTYSFTNSAPGSVPCNPAGESPISK
jgi:hypothetical protein